MKAGGALVPPAFTTISVGCPFDPCSQVVENRVRLLA
jgi:hypothetical protein